VLEDELYAIVGCSRVPVSTQLLCPPPPLPLCTLGFRNLVIYRSDAVVDKLHVFLL
jgi:hypothetical protein